LLGAVEGFDMHFKHATGQNFAIGSIPQFCCGSFLTSSQVFSFPSWSKLSTESLQQILHASEQNLLTLSISHLSLY